jgi:hypothetical protein
MSPGRKTDKLNCFQLLIVTATEVFETTARYMRYMSTVPTRIHETSTPIAHRAPARRSVTTESTITLQREEPQQQGNQETASEKRSNEIVGECYEEQTFERKMDSNSVNIR